MLVNWLQSILLKALLLIIQKEISTSRTAKKFLEAYADDRILKSTASIQFTNWITKSESNVYWNHPDGCNFALDSKVYIPPGLCKYFG